MNASCFAQVKYWEDILKVADADFSKENKYFEQVCMEEFYVTITVTLGDFFFAECM